MTSRSTGPASFHSRRGTLDAHTTIDTIDPDTAAASSSVPTPPSPPPPPAGPLGRAWQAYLRELARNPFRTKCLTSGVLAALGDLVGQGIVGGSAGLTRIRLRRNTFAFAFAGTFWAAPFFNWWFPFLDRMVPPGSSMVVARKLVLDRLVGAPPFLFVQFLLVALANGKSPRDALAFARMLLGNALRTSIVFWTVCNYVNFTKVPVPLRLLYGNVCALFWNVYLSVQSTK